MIGFVLSRLGSVAGSKTLSMGPGRGKEVAHNTTLTLGMELYLFCGGCSRIVSTTGRVGDLNICSLCRRNRIPCSRLFGRTGRSGYRVVLTMGGMVGSCGGRAVVRFYGIVSNN